MNNKTRIIAFLFSLLILCLIYSSGAFSATVPLSTAPLIYSNNFNYLGAFRVPASDSMNNSGSAIAYNPAKNSLFIIGAREQQKVSEISIPTLVKSSTITNLNTATVLQPLTDITEGNLGKIGAGTGIDPNGSYIGGLLFYGNKIIGTNFGVFDTTNFDIKSHFTSGLNLSTTGDFAGMFQVGSTPDVPTASFVSGWMTNVPADLQTALGGPVLTGQGGLSIISRTSSGPAAFAFDPEQLGVSNPVSAIPLLYYPIDHQTVGSYGSQGLGYHQGVNFGGMAMVNGSRSVLFFSTMGIGISGYGGATTNPVFADQCTAPDTCTTSRGYSVCVDVNNCTTGRMALPHDPLCDITNGLGCFYDPTNGTEGPHAFPYIHQVWAYDANDLAAVKAGTKNPWDVVPYATFPMPNLGTPAGPGSAITTTYDSTHGILYVAEPGVDHTGCCTNTPLIHAFSINLSATTASTYKVGGQVMLLNGSLTLRNNGTDELTITATDRKTTQKFLFPTPVVPGSTYNVTISKQPDGLSCAVLNGKGTVNANVDISTIVITCSKRQLPKAPVNLIKK